MPDNNVPDDNRAVDHALHSHMDSHMDKRAPGTFLEETALIFRIPALILLGLLTLDVLYSFTVTTGELLDLVLGAFSRAAALKSGSFLGAHFHDLIAAAIWFVGLTWLLRQARGWFGGSRPDEPAGSTERLLPLGLLVVLGVLFFVVPSVYGLAPLYVPLGLIVLLSVIHVVRDTHVVAMALRELAALLLNPLGYFVLTVFAVVLAILYFSAVGQLQAADPTSELNIAPLQAFFGAARPESREFNFLIMAILLIIPVITMRLVAEEKRSGTQEVLLTTPVRDWHVVVGKFAGTFLFYLIMWVLATIPFLFLGMIGHLDVWQVHSSLLGMAVIGFGLLGLGLLASSITRDQLAAAVLTFLGMLLFTFQTFVTLPHEGTFGWLRTAAEYLDLRQHLAWVARGTVDSRTVFLFLSLGVFSLFLSVRALETRRWAGFSLRKRMSWGRGAVAALGILAMVAVLFWLGDHLGRRQVAALQTARMAEREAEQRTDEEIRAAAAAVPKKPGRLFEDRKKEEGPQEKPGPEEPRIKAAESVPAEAKPGGGTGTDHPHEHGTGDAHDPDEGPAKKPDTNAQEKKGNASQDDRDDPSGDPAAATKKTDDGTKPDAGGHRAGDAGNEKSIAATQAGTPTGTKPGPDTPVARAEKPESLDQAGLKATWTPRRILWVVGAALILLMLYLALFARWLSGGLHNQIVFGSNVIVGGLAAFTLVVLMNYLAIRNHKALDLTTNRIYSLDTAVQSAVDGALREGESVQVIALVGRYDRPSKRDRVQDNIRRDALELLFQKFAEAMNRPGVKRFDYTFIDPYPRSTDTDARERLKQILSQYSASARDVIVRYRNRHEILNANALFERVEDPERFREFLEDWRNEIRRGGFAPPLPTTKREQWRVAEAWLKQMNQPDYLRTVRARPDLQKVVADTIVELVKNPSLNLYYTVGHGEKKMEFQRGAADLERHFGEASVFRQTLVRENFNLSPLAPLTGDRTIPSRCRYLLVAGPTRPFAAEEIDKIRKWVTEQDGRLIVFTEASHQSNLNPLLRAFRMEVEKAQIWYGQPTRGGGMPGGQLMPFTPLVRVDKFDDDHPISRTLARKDASPTPTRDMPVDTGLSVVMLFASPLKILEQADVPAGEWSDIQGWKVTPLLRATIMGQPGPQMLVPWAETELDAYRPQQESKERTGAFNVALIAEPVASAASDTEGKPEETSGKDPPGTNKAGEKTPPDARGKVVVVGDTDFIEDRIKLPDSWPPSRTTEVSPYGATDNAEFVRATLDYLKKQTSGIEVDIKPPTPFHGRFEPHVLSMARWVLWLIIPALLAALGLVVFVVRRSA